MESLVLTVNCEMKKMKKKKIGIKRFSILIFRREILVGKCYCFCRVVSEEP